jgi:hypothetical protein
MLSTITLSVIAFVSQSVTVGNSYHSIFQKEILAMQLMVLKTSVTKEMWSWVFQNTNSCLAFDPTDQ